jgi:hypothetical protein
VTNVDVALEAAGPGGSQMAAAQAAGIDVISGGATIQFKLYRRVVLPIDGFVFWVRADVLNQGSQMNGQPLNSAPLNTMSQTLGVATKQIRPSSLHHTTINQREETQSFSLQTMTLTAQEPVDFLTEIAPTDLWVGEHGAFRFAFSRRTGFYRQANTYHYKGDALYPSMESQLIEYPEQMDYRQVVSNSLPIWLSIPSPFQLYPGYLVPDNLMPPYGVVHIGDDATAPLQSFSIVDSQSSRFQLVRDQVRITTYGVRNDDILDWIETVIQYTLDHPSLIGLMNSPVPHDDKYGQVEFGVLAQKKTTPFEVNYYQTRMQQLSRQLITSAFIEDFLPETF